MGEDERISLQDQIKQLTLQKRKLERELHMTRSNFDKITQMLEAKDTLGQVLSAATVKQKAYTDILLESCPNIMLLLDDDGRFVLGTRMFLTLSGIPNFDFIKNRSYKEVFSAYVDEAVLMRLAVAIEDVRRSRETINLTEWIDFSDAHDPRCYSIELMSISTEQGNAAGISSGILTVFIDLTDILREKQRSEAANSAKSDFLAVMSHEIRTPMNAILGMTEMIGRSELNPLQERYLSDIRKSSRSLLTIINDILDFSKIEAGKLEIISTNFKLRALIDDLQALFIVLFAEKHLELVFEISDHLPTNANGDENRLRQILTNLLSNGLKYTNTGRVVFSAWLAVDDKIRFDVQDTGIGIREEDVSKLFQPFEQLDTRKNKNVVGTGLGLAICHRLCKVMGGDLWVESTYGSGSTFSVCIPYVPAREGEVSHDQEAPPEFVAPLARVLVVDDIEINLAVAEAMLGVFEIQATLVTRGQEALDLAQEHEYDIIFMDHMMPEMDGVEATARIRDLGGRNEKVPIIALTANAVNGAEEMFLQHRFDGFLPKPIELAALNRCLRKWLTVELIEELDFTSTEKLRKNQA